MSSLFNSIEYLKGLGTKRAKLLGEELNLKTFEDLLHFYPFRYEDRSKFYKINEIQADLPYVQLVGQLVHIEEVGLKQSKRLVAKLKDESSSIELVWFRSVKFLKSTLKLGEKYVVFAKPNAYKGIINLVHPEMELLLDYKNSFQPRLQPVYHTSEKLIRSGLHSKNISKASADLLTKIKGLIQENLPQNILSEYGLINREEALFNIHYPQDTNKLQQAIFRLKFEELFLIQLNLLKLKLLNTQKSQGFEFTVVGDYFNQFYQNYLSFDLTNAQKRVIKEIRKDLGSGHQMNRLLQGDVGSGKTIVALMCILLALDNGYQAAMMAPTEILAQQHFVSLTEALGELGIEFAILTGSTKTAARREIHEKLEIGSLQILIGTHALIEEKVKFKNLGLAVIDEQHRFGVAQRAKLWKKNIRPPHVLIMTATPIPRTLAMTLYGDLDVSVIDELPPGRKDIKTIHWFESKRLRLFGFLEQEIKKGRQVYIVYPLIEESEKLDFANLEEGYQHIFNRFAPPDYKVSIVHGKMSSDTKAFEMKRFVDGETDIMVSTTVIEVGVNVPNASVMVIESAERFGLSQLHQLRGRVGRGAEQSYCILMTGNKLSSDGKLRMKTMVGTNDGFQVAEVDLRLRGPGDLQGTQQSGTPINLKLTNLAKDGEIIEIARKAAQAILAEDPDLKNPENNRLLKFLKEQRKGKTNWSKIS
tara:strand:+ start:795 stop:2897 length:2103 start_codon:yes stop_codon:yes gene_type:complete